MQRLGNAMYLAIDILIKADHWLFMRILDLPLQLKPICKLQLGQTTQIRRQTVLRGSVLMDHKTFPELTTHGEIQILLPRHSLLALCKEVKMLGKFVTIVRGAFQTQLDITHMAQAMTRSE